MKTYCTITMIGLFLLLWTGGIEAQTGTQAGNSVNSQEVKEMIRILAKAQNADTVGYMDKDGRNLLMYASVNGYTRLCRILIRKGAKINEQANDGTTAIMYASNNGKARVVKLLLKIVSKMLF